MLEKLYKCKFCNNRFGNKSEAKRHQNSLHLRHQSWSCRTILGYEAAFRLSTSHRLSYDACSYCGKEFSNFPCDWDARIKHLTNIMNSVNAIRPKSSFDQIISASISNTVTPAQVGTGPTCLRMLAYRTSRLYQRHQRWKIRNRDHENTQMGEIIC